MGSSPLISSELVERLWEQVRQREATTSIAATLDLHQQTEPLVHDEAIRYINQNWEGRAPVTPGESSGLKGRIRIKIASLVLSMFGDYLEHEQQLHANTVRAVNALAASHDRLSADIRLLAEAITTEGDRIMNDMELQHRLIEARVADLEKGTRSES